MESTLTKSVKVEPVNAVMAGTTVKRKDKSKGVSGNRTCYMCERGYPHRGKCPSAGKQCTNCHWLNHYAKVCCSTPKTKPERPKTAHSAQVIQPQEDSQEMGDDDEPDGMGYLTTGNQSFKDLRSSSGLATASSSTERAVVSQETSPCKESTSGRYGVGEEQMSSRYMEYQGTPQAVLCDRPEWS
ncbi:hypothetical protein NDU88_006005 [Pleurodeles waltl]|uniref:Uncharacterized protein n=1 Tax=Pleurodeles waltl TaxID=8319 RepID=A0AAV7VKS4_PLEWA|nr:hypothetical protein NDU88_006005 [Pleurodeles waltl]